MMIENDYFHQWFVYIVKSKVGIKKYSTGSVLYTIRCQIGLILNTNTSLDTDNVALYSPTPLQYPLTVDSANASTLWYYFSCQIKLAPFGLYGDLMFHRESYGSISLQKMSLIAG